MIKGFTRTEQRFSLLFVIMEGETSWVSHSLNVPTRNTTNFNSFSEITNVRNTEIINERNSEITIASLDNFPNDLLERILAYLPIASLFRARSVCKRWKDIVISKSFLRNLPNSNKPWYFMFTSSDEPIGYAYDPILRKWYSIDLPCIESSDWIISPSRGLICFMDNDSRSNIYVCNPMTKVYKSLEEPPGVKFSDYSALAISVNRVNKNSCEYVVSVVKSKQAPGDFFMWDISIHAYYSGTMMWTTLKSEVLAGWRAGDESVICDGILYFLIYSTGGMGNESRHGLIAYDLSARSNGSLMKSCIPAPCSLTCGRLMNHKEELVMVGGIGKIDRPDIIKGIGIWVLKGREWREIGRMPHKFFQGFGEFDDVFASSGTGNVIYIQSYGAPALLVYDISLKHWKWSQKCPVTKKFPLQLFSGFCFEPRLEMEP